MALKYLSSEIITSCRDAGMIPSASSLGSEDDDLLKKINEAIRTILVPRVIKMREEYFVARSRTALSTRARIRIPHRAMYGKLRDLWLIDSTGERIPLSYHDEEGMSGWQSDTSDSNPSGFFLEGDYVVLLPETATTFTGYLEFVFFMRPSDLVSSSYYTTVSTVVDEYTVTCGATYPAAWVADYSLDIHSPYSGAELKVWDRTIHAISTSTAGVTTIEFHEKIDGSVYGTHPVAIGDYICSSESCAIPALPREWHPLIARAAALYFAESVGDLKGAQLHSQILEKNIEDAVSASESRIEGKPIRLTGRRGFIGW